MSAPTTTSRPRPGPAPSGRIPSTTAGPGSRPGHGRRALPRAAPSTGPHDPARGDHRHPRRVPGHPADLHAVAPKTYGPAGGYESYDPVAGVLYVFGFIVAATLGSTAGRWI